MRNIVPFTTSIALFLQYTQVESASIKTLNRLAATESWFDFDYLPQIDAEIDPICIERGVHDWGDATRLVQRSSRNQGSDSEDSDTEEADEAEDEEEDINLGGRGRSAEDQAARDAERAERQAARDANQADKDARRAARDADRAARDGDRAARDEERDAERQARCDAITDSVEKAACEERNADRQGDRDERRAARDEERAARRAGPYFNSDAYQAKSALEKMNELWEQLNIEQTVICQQFEEMAIHFHQKLTPSFKLEGDEMPFERDTNDIRNKLVHQQGTVATAKFIAETNPYSGIFQGSQNAIIRLSDAHLYVDGVTTEHIAPSVAVKFLIDGKRSANYLGMVSFGDAGQGMNFFEKDFTNHLPGFDPDIPDDEECGAQTIARFHSSAPGGQRFNFSNGTKAIAEIDENGNEVADADIDFPFEVILKPIRENLPVTQEDVQRFYEQVPHTVPSNTHMFDVWARDLPTDPDSETFQIGRIETTSEFTQSLWGDERLFFQHNWMFLDRQFWNNGRKRWQMRDVAQFDFDQVDRWNNGYDVPTPTKDQVIDGMIGGCPFQWIIDYITEADPTFDRIEEETKGFLNDLIIP